MRVLTPFLLCAIILGPHPSVAQVSGAWEALAEAPVGKFEGAAVALDGKLYVFGGFGAGVGALARADLYDPAKDEWTSLADLPRAITHLNPVVQGNSIWFAGGFDGPGAPVADNVRNRDQGIAVFLPAWSER